jgi:hypothetical protein
VVGPSSLRRATWVVGVALAAGTIIALAFHGRRPDTSLVHFEPAGVMLAIAPDTVVEVVVIRGQRRWRFEHAGANSWAATTGPPPAESVATHLDTGLRFLHVSAPQRVLQPDEVVGISPSEFGLAPPRYVVSVRAPGAPPFEIEFGALSPQGLAQYARVTGHPGILLLPSFIGEQWESVMDAP